MTNPIASSPGAIKSQAAPAGAALQEVAAQRVDDIARKLRRAEEVTAIATDKTSTTEARGISKTASDLSRGASLWQVADPGLDAIAASLRRIQSLIDKAADPATKKEEHTRLQVELDTVRQEVSRVVQTMTVRGTVFDLGTFVPDAKALAAAINAVQGENGVLEAHADPNVLVGVSTGYRSGRGAAGDGGGEGDDHGGSD